MFKWKNFLNLFFPTGVVDDDDGGGGAGGVGGSCRVWFTSTQYKKCNLIEIEGDVTFYFCILVNDWFIVDRIHQTLLHSHFIFLDKYIQKKID